VATPRNYFRKFIGKYPSVLPTIEEQRIGYFCVWLAGPKKNLAQKVPKAFFALNLSKNPEARPEED
jgi:hypothetical protein